MTEIHEDVRLRNRHSIFRDRFEAGRSLGEFMASEYEGLDSSVVLAIPAGGVPVGIEVSRRLKLPFDCLIVRKIQIPGNTEAGFGAVASGGETMLNRDLVHRLGLRQEEIDAQIDKVQRELEVRERLFRNNRPLPDFSGQTVILTDDGLASGFTMLAAMETVRNRGGRKVVVAVPTAPLSSVRRVEHAADAVISLHIQEAGPFAVANAYQHWHDLTREDVARLLQSS
ncbi:MAG: phosphoribosyltransferase family protein [Desulfobia sp.]